MRKHFTDSGLYVVLSTNDSFEADKENVIKAIEEFVGSIDFVIWDTKFEKVIEFTKIGVFREGRLAFPVLI